MKSSWADKWDRLCAGRERRQSAWRSPRLWVTVILVGSTLLLTGCKPFLGWLMFGWMKGNNHAQQRIIDPRPIKVAIAGREDPEVAPGGGGARVFEAHGNQAGLHFVWWPPLGARDFDFRAGDEPLPGGPPFIWEEIPHEGIAVLFRYAPVYDSDVTQVTDTFSALDGSFFERDTVVATTKLVQSGGAQASGSATAGSPLPAAEPLTAAPAGDAIEAWRTIRSFSPQNSLSTARCQDLVDFVQDDSAFLALRLPLSPTASITQTASILLYLGEPYSNTFRIATVIPSSSTHITVPLGLRRERLDFAANHLPQAAGETWVTLGGWGDALTCPPGIDTPAGNWLIQHELLLDLTGQPDNCADCLLPGYYCYEGEDLPATAGVSMAGAGVTYQGDGITCFGPDITDLNDTKQWTLGGAGTQAISPTQVISLPHFVYVQTGSMTLTLEVTSTVDVTWGVYEGSASAPNLAAPIGLPWTVTGFEDFWLVSSAVPATTTHGGYSVQLSATDVSVPTNTRHNSSLLWVGDWVAPVPPRSCNPPASVTIAGPVTTTLDAATTFTATVTPLTDTAILSLTTPLVYTWETSGQPAQLHTSQEMQDAAVFTWPLSEAQTVTVTVDSPCMVTVLDTHAVTPGGGHRLLLPAVLRD